AHLRRGHLRAVEPARRRLDVADQQSPIVASLPFLLLLGVMLWLALRLRAEAPDRGVPLPLPVRPLGRGCWPALLVPAVNLGAGVGVPVFVLARWACGSAQQREPMSFAYLQQSFAKAVDQGVPDLVHSLWLAAGVAALVVLL